MWRGRPRPRSSGCVARTFLSAVVAVDPSLGHKYFCSDVDDADVFLRHAARLVERKIVVIVGGDHRVRRQTRKQLNQLRSRDPLGVASSVSCHAVKDTPCGERESVVAARSKAAGRNARATKTYSCHGVKDTACGERESVVAEDQRPRAGMPAPHARFLKG